MSDKPKQPKYAKSIQTESPWVTNMMIYFYITTDLMSVGQVIVEKVNGAQIANLDRKKYLVPGDLTGK